MKGRTVSAGVAVGAGFALVGVAIVEGLLAAGLRPFGPLGWPAVGMLAGTALRGMPGLAGGALVGAAYFALSLLQTGRFPAFFGNSVVVVSWLVVLAIAAVAVLAVRPRLLRAAIAEAELDSLKGYEKALRESEERLRIIADNLPAFVSYIDADERYQFVNRAYEDWFRLPRDQVVGRTVREVWGAERHALFKPNIERALRGENVTYEFTLVVDSTPRSFLARYVPDSGAGGRVKGFFVLASDITDLPATRANRVRTGPAKILVVDDDASLRQLVALHLRNSGYDVLEAEDAIAAGRVVVEHAPDAAIVDVQMPYMSGYDFVRALRADPATQRMPVLFLTIDEGVAAEAAKLGATFLLKPVKADVLLDRVRKLVQAARSTPLRAA